MSEANCEADRAMAATTMKSLRRHRGMSLADLARALREHSTRTGQPLAASQASVQRTVARWEAARPVPPGARYRHLLALHYGHSPSGETALGAGSDFAELCDALAHFGVGEEELRNLRDLMVRIATADGCGLLALLSPSVRAPLAAALADPTRTDEDLTVHLGALVADVDAQVSSMPFARLQLLLAPAVDACHRLIGGELPAPLRPAMHEVAAAAFTLAGRLAFETRDDAAAAALYDAATAAAAVLPPWRRASVHMSHALVTLYGTPGRDRDGLPRGLGPARAFVDAAVCDARAGDSVTVRARTHALQAEIAARAGQRRHAEAALSLARYDLGQNQHGDPVPSSFTTSHLQGFEGLYELYVGDAETAHRQFAASVAALTAPREQVQRSIVRVDQALARLRLGDAKAATELLHLCVEAASGMGGRVPALRLREARRQLRPWRREGFVADLDDHLIDLLGT
ncbi:hypothetical protein ACWGJ2_12860 [Streptomyces sp. NPDC054796]